MSKRYWLSACDDFTRAYIECALWASTDTGAPLDAKYDVNVFTVQSIRTAIATCEAFQALHAPLLARAGTPAQNGHDLWLTRARHGTGFWDRGYPDAVGDALTAAARALGECDVIEYRGRLYIT